MSNPDVINPNTSIQGKTYKVLMIFFHLDLLGLSNRQSLYQNLIDTGNGNPITDAYLLTKSKSFMPLINAKASHCVVFTAFQSALTLAFARIRCPEFELYNQTSMILMGENDTLPLRGYSCVTFCEKYTVLFIWSGKEYRLFSDYDGEQTEELDLVYANYVRWFIDPENPIQAITVSRLRTVLPDNIPDDIRQTDQEWFQKSGFERFEEFYLVLLSYQRYLRYFTIILDALFDDRLENLNDSVYEKYSEFHADRKRELNEAYTKLLGNEEKGYSSSSSQQDKVDDDGPVVPATPIIPATPNLEDYIKPVPLDLSELPEPEGPLSEEEIFEMLSPVQSTFQEVMMSPSNLFTNYEFPEPLHAPKSPEPEPTVEVAGDELVPEVRTSNSTPKRKKSDEGKVPKAKKHKTKNTKSTPKKMADVPRVLKKKGEITKDDQLVASGKRCWTCGIDLAKLDETYTDYNTTILCPFCSAFVTGIGKFIPAHKRCEPRTESWAYFEQVTKQDAKGKKKSTSLDCRLEILPKQVDLSMKRPCKKRCNMCHRKSWKIEKYREALSRKTSYARDICYLCYLKTKHLDAELTRLDMEMASIELDPESSVCFDAFAQIRELRNLNVKDQTSWGEIFPRGPASKKRNSKSKNKKPKASDDKIVIAIDDDIEEEVAKEPSAKKQKTKPDEIEESEPFGFDEIITGHELPLEDVDSDQDELPLNLKRKSAERPSKSTPPPQTNKSKSIEITNGRFAQDIPAPVPIIKKKKKQEIEESPVHVVFSDENFKSEKIQNFVPSYYSQENLGDAIKIIRKAMLPKPHRLLVQSIDECFRNLRLDLEKIELMVSISGTLEKFGTMGVVLLIEQFRALSAALMEKELPRLLEPLEPQIWELRLNYPHYSIDRHNSISVSELFEKIFDVIETVNRDAHKSLLVMLFTL